MIDQIDVSGLIRIEVFDSFGVLKDKQIVKNTVTTLGKEHIAGRMINNPTANPMNNMAIGTGTPSSTALGTEISRKILSKSVSGAVVTYVARWDIEDGVSGTITEAGIFNLPTLGGTMLNSGTMSVAKATNDSLVITWTLTIA